MSAKKKALKFLIIIILAIFLLSTGLISVLYLGGKGNSNGTGEVLLWDAIESGIDVSTGSETIDTGAAQLPEMTREEAAKQIQQILSGN